MCCVGAVDCAAGLNVTCQAGVTASAAQLPIPSGSWALSNMCRANKGA